MAADRTRHSRHVEVKVAGDEHYAEHHREYQAETLQQVGPYHRLYTAAEGIEPHDTDRHNDIDPERDAERLAHKRLQHDAHHEKSHRCTEHLGHDEKPVSYTHLDVYKRQGFRYPCFTG